MASKAEEQRIEGMKRRIAEDPGVAFRVLRAIWDRQTPREKYTHEHQGHDGRGFAEEDTAALNALHDKLEDAGWRWRELPAADVYRCQRQVKKYARQYLAAERERRDAELEKSRAFVAEAGARSRAAAQDAARKRWGDAAVVG